MRRFARANLIIFFHKSKLFLKDEQNHRKKWNMIIYNAELRIAGGKKQMEFYVLICIDDIHVFAIGYIVRAEV